MGLKNKLHYPLQFLMVLKRRRKYCSIMRYYIRLVLTYLLCNFPMYKSTISCDAGSQFKDGTSSSTIVFVDDYRVYKFSYNGEPFDHGTLSIVAGPPDYLSQSSFANGVGTSARFSTPISLFALPESNELIVSDYNNHQLRKVDIVSGTVTTYAGKKIAIQTSLDGPGTNSTFSFPKKIAGSLKTGLMYVSSTAYFLRQVTFPLVYVSTIYPTALMTGTPVKVPDGFVTVSGAQTDTGRLSANFEHSISQDGTFFIITDKSYNSVRILNLASSTVSTIAGGARLVSGTYVSSGCQDGLGTIAMFKSPAGVVIKADNSIAFIIDSGNYAIRIIDLGTLSVSYLIGSCPSTVPAYGGGFMVSQTINDMVLSPDETYLFAATPNGFYKILLSTKWAYLLGESPSSGLSPLTRKKIALFPRLMPRCEVCANGKYSKVGSACVVCPAGFFCNSTTPIACPSGI